MPVTVVETVKEKVVPFLFMKALLLLLMELRFQTILQTMLQHPSQTIPILMALF